MSGGEVRRAAIHDLGYRGYLGSRRPQSTRWQVIVKNLLRSAWRGWWKTKLWLLPALAIVVGFAVAMYVSRYAAARGGLPASWVDEALPMSFGLFPWPAFIVSMTVVATIVSDDLRAGAFEFYFSRPVRPGDYVAGKLAGASLIMAIFLLAGPLLLSLFRLGLCRDLDEVLSALIVVPKTLLVGTVASVAMAALALAFSTLSSEPRYTLAGWAAFFVLGGGTAAALSQILERPAIAAISPKSAIAGLASGVFGAQLPNPWSTQPPLWACALSLAGYLGVSLALISWRIRGAQRRGLGGG